MAANLRCSYLNDKFSKVQQVVAFKVVQHALNLLNSHGIFVGSFQLIDVVGTIRHALQRRCDGLAPKCVLRKVLQQVLFYWQIEKKLKACVLASNAGYHTEPTNIACNTKTT